MGWWLWLCVKRERGEVSLRIIVFWRWYYFAYISSNVSDQGFLVLGFFIGYQILIFFVLGNGWDMRGLWGRIGERKYRIGVGNKRGKFLGVFKQELEWIWGDDIFGFVFCFGFQIR